MSKIKITPKQYNAIIFSEQLDKSLSNGELLEEGWKEVVLGTAMLMGVGLSGINKISAQNALKNDSVMSQIKQTLEDENKIKELSKAFADKGMKNPDSLIVKNAKKAVNQFNKLAQEHDKTYRVSEKAVETLESLDAELKKGYALKKAEIESDTTQNETKSTTIIIKDSLNLTLNNDKTFISGGYTLSSGGVDSITSLIDNIKKLKGKVLSVSIESSTDAEPMPKFKTEYDQTGNIKLAELRTKSIADLLTNLEDDVRITHREIPNNGSEVVDYKEFLQSANDKELLNSLRAKTAKFRYVKMSLTVQFEDMVNEDVKPEIVIQKFRFELAKVIDIDKGINENKPIFFKHKKTSCKRSKKVIQCFTF